jgi:hypothetical protein
MRYKVHSSNYGAAVGTSSTGCRWAIFLWSLVWVDEWLAGVLLRSTSTGLSLLFYIWLWSISCMSGTNTQRSGIFSRVEKSRGPADMT